MKKETAMKVFRDVLEKSGMKDFVSLSETPNELADLMVYEKPDRPAYLACNGRPLFEFWEINNILYLYGEGEEKLYHFVGTKIQFVIELQGDARYVLEYGENGFCEAMHLYGAWATEEEEIQTLLTQYNWRVTDKNNIENLIYAVLKMIEENEKPTKEEQQEIAREVKRYMTENPWDKDLLFGAVNSLVQAMVYEDADLPLTIELMRQIVCVGDEDGFMAYMRREEGPVDGVPGYYVTLAAGALRLIREIKEEKTSE